MAPLPSSSKGPRPIDPARGEIHLGRRSILELARIYVSACAFQSAIDALDRLVPNSWDEEAHLVRAEALLGLGRTIEAESLLGPPLLPGSDASSSDRQATTWLGPGQTRPTEKDPVIPPVIPRWGEKSPRRRAPSRRERIGYWRFLLQLRVLHRTGRYRQVIELGRAFFSGLSPQPSVNASRIATVVAQSLLALRQPAAARSLYQEILELNTRLRWPEGAADTLLGMANSQLLDCHWDEADALYQEAMYRYEELGQSDKALACKINLGILRGKRGDLTGGRALLLQTLTRASQLGDSGRLSSIHLGLGFIEARLGNHQAARAWLRAALHQSRLTRSPRTRALAFEFLGELHLYQRRLARARACLESGRRIAREIAPEGDLLFEIRRRQAEVAFEEGKLSVARFLASEAHEMALAFGDVYEAAVADRVIAQVEAAEGRPHAALARAAAARDALDRLGETYERARVELFRVHLEHGLGLIPEDRVLGRVDDACRAFSGMPESPVCAEARRIREGLAGWIAAAAPVCNAVEDAVVAKPRRRSAARRTTS